MFVSFYGLRLMFFYISYIYINNDTFFSIIHFLLKSSGRNAKACLFLSMASGLCSFIYIIIIYYRYSALGPVWAETRAQSVDWYSSGTLHPGQVLRGSLPLLSPAFRRSHFRHQVPQRRERS